MPLKSKLIFASLAIMPAASLLGNEGVPRVLLDRALQERQVQLVGIDSQQVIFRDSAGLLRSEPVQRLVAITATTQYALAPILDGDGPGSESVLELTDGQRLVGKLITGGVSAPTGETLRWAHPLLGEMNFRLDDVQRISLRTLDAAPVAAAVGDVVLLRNGDRLEGFIESIGGDVIIEVNGQSHTLPVDRIASIVLANPEDQLSGPVLWMRDGSIVAIASFAPMPEGQVAFVPRTARGQSDAAEASESMALPVTVSEVLGVAFEAQRITPLASLQVVRQEPASGRRWSPPLRRSGPHPALLNAHDLELPGPMVAEWVLPAGATHFATEAELPRSNWNWGDCILIVSLVSGQGESESETEVSRTRINAENPSVPVRISLQSHARQRSGPMNLRIRLDPGMYGPIQDQIILRNPIILLERVEE